ncbi:MAG: hypothetical protein V3W20_12625 [Candidatus Neomarinimicrobiota bacterium]
MNEKMTSVWISKESKIKLKSFQQRTYRNSKSIDVIIRMLYCLAKTTNEQHIKKLRELLEDGNFWHPKEYELRTIEKEIANSIA